jgi:hypothetical protein
VATLIVVSLAIGVGAVVLLARGHAGRLTPPGSGGRVSERATLEMPRGKTTRVMHLKNVPANVPYDVVVRTAAGAQLTVNMDVHGAEPGWNATGCAWRAGHVTCHYRCDGSVPGGNWSLIVTKTSLPAVPVSIRVTFDRA